MTAAAGTSAGRAIGWWGIWALIALLALAVVATSYVNHDAAWYLHMAGVLLDGGTIYRDVLDTNPPLIVYLTIPPVWVGRVLGLSEILVFKAYVLGAAAASLVVVSRLAHRIWPAPAIVPQLVIAVVVFLALPFAKEDFSQREHFAVLLTLPYVFAAAAWLTGHRVRAGQGIALGVAAGLGFAIKPHFLLGWLAVEGWLALAARDRRSWARAEVVAAVAALAVYGLIVILAVPQYLVLADAVRQVYGGLNSSPALLLRLPDVRLWGAGAVLLALIKLPPARRATPVFFAAATGLVLAGILQLKGWQYHLYPGRVYLLLFLAVWAVEALVAAPALAGLIRGGLRSVAGVVAGILIVSSARYVVEAGRPVSPDLVTPLLDTIRRHAPRGPVAVLSMRTIIYPAFPAVNYASAVWSLRHNSLWFLPGLYPDVVEGVRGERAFRPPEAMGPIEREFYEQIVSDLCARPPALLLIEPPIARAAPGRRAIDLAAYYAQDPRFARLLAAYDELTVIGPFVVLAPRTGTASCAPDG